MTRRGAVGSRAWLLDRDALREVTRLIDVAAAANGNVVREQLERYARGETLANQVTGEY